MQRAQERIAHSASLGLLSTLQFQPLLLDYGNVRQSTEQKVRILTDLLATESLCVRVKTEENSLVAERVLLLRPGTLLGLLASGAHNRLDLVAVDETGYVGVRDLGSGQASEESVSASNQQRATNM